ncbi:MAG TPA: YceI family protein [Candidatus Dormibacteraeota bacterium]
MTSTLSPTPVLAPGTWTIDASHSEVSFSVRHLMVSKVRGTFRSFSGTFTTAQDPALASVEASIDVASVDTRDERRDGHLRSADFFDVENHPVMTYRSSGVRAKGDGYVVDGELTLRGVTRPVELRLEHNGVSGDPWGGTRSGFSATAEINRRDFGIDISMPLEGGGVVVGDKVTVQLEVEAVLQQAA